MIGRAIAEGTLPDGSFLNVNVPALPVEAVRGVAITRVAPGGYVHLAERTDGAFARTGARLGERLQRELVHDERHAHPGTDIRAVLDGYVSVSPLDTSLSHEGHIEQLAPAAGALFRELTTG
jgi:5'-nucleotidase